MGPLGGSGSSRTDVDTHPRVVRESLAVDDVRPREDFLRHDGWPVCDVIDERQTHLFSAGHNRHASKRRLQRVPDIVGLSMAWHPLVEVTRDDEGPAIAEVVNNVAEQLTELKMFDPNDGDRHDLS